MSSNEPRESGFIGRQLELAVLTAALDDALSGRGQMVMLAGEPGIGKTRLAQELATHAESLGVRVLWGWCYEGEGAPPYWPWVQPMRSYVQGHDAAQLRSEAGPGAVDIAEIVPELQEKLPDLPSQPPLNPVQARFRLFDSLTTFLKNAAQFQPIMLVLEDLHWADRSSLLLLEFLAREIETSPLLLVGTYRDVEVTGRHPLSQTLGSLVRSQHFRRVQLEGLTQPEVGEFVEAIAGINLPGDAVEVVHRRTEGNPLFVGEVVRLVSPEQMADIRAWTDTIPAGVRDIIGRRLNQLSEDCNQVLRTASVIGREFDFKLLNLLSRDIDEERLLEVLDEALAARAVEEVQHVAGRHQFAHALIQETLAEELSANRKVRLHARIAETLEELYGENVEVHAAELAHHFAQAEAVVGSEKLAYYSMLAGERALGNYAWEDAQAYFQRALIVKQVPVSGSEKAPDAEGANLLFGLGRAHAAMMQSEETLGCLSRAFDYYIESGDTAQAIAIAEYPHYIRPGDQTAASQFIPRALAMVTPDSIEEGRLLSIYGSVLALEQGDYEGGQKAFSRALTISRQEKNVTLEIRTLANAMAVDGFHCRWQENFERNLRATELAPQADDLRAEVDAYINTVRVQNMMGDPEGAKPHAAAGLAAAERLRDRMHLVRALGPNVSMTVAKGEWQAARAYSDCALSHAPRDAPALSNRTLLEYQVGNFDQGEVYIERLLEVMRLSRPGPNVEYSFPAAILPMIARISGRASWFDTAVPIAETMLSLSTVVAVRIILARVGLALIAEHHKDIAAAQQQYVALEPYRGIATIAILMSVDRVLGLLAQTMGNLDTAMTHFEDGLAFCREAGYRPELAWTCCDYAEMLLERSGDGDRAGSISMLGEALAISSELGMRPLMERVLVLQQRAEAQPVPAPAYPDGLSLREVEVLRLISGGKTDREIGEELFISARTVGHHVGNILNKTNTANRAEAATYAAMNGLTMVPGPDPQ